MKLIHVLVTHASLMVMMEIQANSPTTPYISATAVRKFAVNCSASFDKSWRPLTAFGMRTK